MFLIKKLKEEQKKTQQVTPSFDLVGTGESLTKEVNLSSYGKPLQECKIVDGLFYLESYLEKTTCDKLLDMIENQSLDQWVTLKHANRRLQKWGRHI